MNGKTSYIHGLLNGTLTATGWVYVSEPEKIVECKYNSAGLRVQKDVTINGITETTKYILRGKQIAEMICGEHKLHFFYDAQNRPTKVHFNGELYTYVHSLQGDIVGLLDGAGNLVVEYKYDAWGNLLSITNSMAETLGKLNPFRYRGYIYDEETGLYYLRSRYYNSKLVRFINADANIGQIGYIFYHSLFVYCRNSVPNFYDPDGAAFLIALYVGAVTYLTAVMASPDIYKDVESLAMSASEGDITGIICDAVGIALPGIPSLKGFKIIRSTDEFAEVSKKSKVIQIFDTVDDLDLASAQKHHALPNPPMNYIAKTVPDLDQTRIFRNDWVFRACNLDAHLGYDAPHRALTQKILTELAKYEPSMRAGQFTREELADILMNIYREMPNREKFGYIYLR